MITEEHRTPQDKIKVSSLFVVVVVVLTLTHRHNTMQSVVAGQAPITLEWKNTSEKNKNKTESNTHDN